MIHIQKFIDRLQGFDARGTKDYTMPLKDAKSLHADITRLLLELNHLREAKNSQPETVQVEITGGDF